MQNTPLLDITHMYAMPWKRRGTPPKQRRGYGPYRRQRETLHSAARGMLFPLYPKDPLPFLHAAARRRLLASILHNEG